MKTKKKKLLFLLLSPTLVIVPITLSSCSNQQPSNNIQTPIQNYNIEFNNNSDYRFATDNLVITDKQFSSDNWYKEQIVNNNKLVFNFKNTDFYNIDYFKKNITIKNYIQDINSNKLSATVELLKQNNQTISKEINIIGFKEYTPPTQPNVDELLIKDIDNINNNISQIKLKKQKYTQQEINNLDNENFLNLALDLNSVPYYDDNLFEIKIINLQKTNLKFSFNIQLVSYDDPTKFKNSNLIELSYILEQTTNPQPQTGVDAAINYLNSLNLEIDPNKLGCNKFINLTDSIFRDTGITKKLKNFDLNKIEQDYKVRISSGNIFNLNAVDYSLRFNLLIKDNGTQKYTKEFNINYIPPKNFIGAIDSLPTINEVKVNNSLKNKLELITTLKPENQLTDKLKLLNENQTIKIREYMYQLRFLYYQLLSDNAISIDYGIESFQNNNLTLILKAKIKDTKTYSPYLQVNQTTLPNISVLSNDIITLKYVVNDFNFKIEKLTSANNIFPGLDGGLSLGQGDKTQLQQSLRTDLSLMKASGFTFSILKNNNLSNIQNITNNRFILFSFLCIVK